MHRSSRSWGVDIWNQSIALLAITCPAPIALFRFYLNGTIIRPRPSLVAKRYGYGCPVLWEVVLVECRVCEQTGNWEKGLEVYSEMKQKHIAPDDQVRL